MILRKPYAFFIKMFKPIHLVMAFLSAYLIFLTNRIVNFLSNYIYSNTNVVGDVIKSKLADSMILVIPIIMIAVCLLMLGIMFNKKKPSTFYVITLFVYLFALIVDLYTSNFLGVMEKNIVDIKMVKLIHDLVSINIIAETCVLVALIVRGIGLDIKKFDFSSEISKFDISEADKEEFELDINMDLSEQKRKRRQRFRYLKYAYVENKFLINCVIIFAVGIIFLVTFGFKNIYNKKNKENITYTGIGYNINVSNSFILNTDSRGKKISNNYLVAVVCKFKLNYTTKEIYYKNFNLLIGEATFKPIDKYNDSLKDLGVGFNKERLSNEYSKYLFVYEIPEKYIKSTMKFGYTEVEKSIYITLKPKTNEEDKTLETKKLGEEMTFNGEFSDIKFKISKFEINKKYSFDYKYCAPSNKCIDSKEYLIPTIDENFDKLILKLDGEYSNTGSIQALTLTDLIINYGTISYFINDKWEKQDSNFEKIVTKRAKSNSSFIGINSDISKAEKIKIEFNLRGNKYEYVLK